MIFMNHFIAAAVYHRITFDSSWEQKPSQYPIKKQEITATTMLMHSWIIKKLMLKTGALLREPTENCVKKSFVITC